ncbi:MAG: glycoside hydrolase family 43 protein [Schleiferiaceae bacterium]
MLHMSLPRLLFVCLITVRLVAQTPSFKNPILPGGYPDPSICYADGVFYLANSTFEYFPGLPIHQSMDLVNWELIGYGLDRAEQVMTDVNLRDVQSDGGIHAPTLRYHDGLFYLITTNVYHHPETQTTDFVNFILTATHPAGPWSNPHVLHGAPGIDPDIFFDDDGRVWYVGTHSPENPSFPGEGEIWLQEIDLNTWSLIGERHFLWRGACGGVWVEGPHLYKRKGRYYLMVAEGGTSFNHAVMMAVSDTIVGPYIPNDRNPIFTSRHLSYDHWAHSTGHADLIQLPDDRWYMVMLGIRGDEQRKSNMGRETFLAPVAWEEEPFWWKNPKYEWPVVSPESGRIEQEYPSPFLSIQHTKEVTFRDEFDASTLDIAWNFRRVPVSKFHSLTAKKGHLRIYTQPMELKDRASASFVGIRQTESHFSYETSMRFNPKTNGSEAGIALVQKDHKYVSLTLQRQGDSHHIQLFCLQPNQEPLKLAERALPKYSGALQLKIISDAQGYSYYYALKDSEYQLLLTTGSDLVLSESYTGTYLGLYSTSHGISTKDFADYDFVYYQGLAKD